jgi:hypothetical protein
MTKSREARRMLLPYALAIAMAEAGCVTAHVVRSANDPHPGIHSPRGVLAAASASNALYLKLEVAEPPEFKTGTMVVSVDMKDLETAASFIPGPQDEAILGLAKLPVRVEKLEAIPEGATFVPVRAVRAATLRDLEDTVSDGAAAAEVWVVDPIAGAELEAWSKDKKGQPLLGPMVALILPDETGEPRVGLFKNLDQVPHARRAWWLVTPFSVVADIVLSPGYLVYALCGGN